MIVGGIQTIEPTVTNEEESEALGVPLHSPAFLFERTTRSADGEIVEYVRSIYRGDRYRLVTELNAAASSRRRATADARVGQYRRASAGCRSHVDRLDDTDRVTRCCRAVCTIWQSGLDNVESCANVPRRGQVV